MKQTILIFVLITGVLHSQFYYGDDQYREKPRTGLKMVETIVEEDTSGLAPYISQISYYNSSGYYDLGIYKNHKGDTIQKIYSLYPGNNSEITVYQTPSKTDTLFEYYDNKNKLTMDVWYWDSDDGWDTTIYHYNTKEKLIKVEEREWRSRDILKYKRDKLVSIRTIEDGNKEEEEDPENYISAKFIYSKDGRSIEKYGYIYSTKPTTITKKTLNENGKCILEEDWKVDGKTKNLQWVHRYEYYENGELKLSTAELWEFGKVKWSVTHTYNEHGWATGSVLKDEIFKYTIRKKYNYYYY